MPQLTSDPAAISLAEILIPAAVSLVVGGLAGLGAAWRQERRLVHEFGLQRERLKTELKLEFATETAIRELLSDDRFEERKRTFQTIKARLGGFDDKELRMHLIRAGAVSFIRRSDGAELWGLRELVNPGQLSGEGENGDG